MIFKLELEFSKFPYEFPETFLGPKQLYIWYLIYAKKGPEHFFKDVEEVIIQRYRVSRVFGINAYNLLNLFLWNGNDQNSCNRFFTRRMKNDIGQEQSDWCALVNNIGETHEELAFKDFFMANAFSSPSARNPFQQPTGSEPGLIEQAIFNHVIGNYCAAANLLFPIVEGICWDISVAEHLAKGGIYTEESNLKTRDLKSRQLIDEQGNPLSLRHGVPTLKEMMEQTRMKNVFHVQFLKFLCSELFPEERNPILHGIRLDYNLPFQSARLLLILEYLHATIKSRKYVYPIQLDQEGYWNSKKSGGSTD